MGAQLPSEVAGQAAAILIYSFVCLAAGCFMLWLVVSHNEWKSCMFELPLDPVPSREHLSLAAPD